MALSGVRRLLLLLFFVVFLHTVSALHIEDVFRLSHLRGRSGCGRYRRLLEDWFQDSVALMDLAGERCQMRDPDSLAYMSNFFKIDPLQQNNPVCHWINTILAFLHGHRAPLAFGGKPWLFCHSSFLRLQEWNDPARDTETGEIRQDGKTVREVIPEHKTSGRRQHYRAYWVEEIKQYYVLRPSFAASCFPTSMVGSATVGLARYSDEPQFILLCVHTILHEYIAMAPGRRVRTPDKLADLSTSAGLQNTGIGISEANVKSLALLHESIHVSLWPHHTTDLAYTLPEILSLDREQAMWNPETYVCYSLAVWLGRKHPGTTFATGYPELERS